MNINVSSGGSATVGGSLTATEGPDAAFDLATSIRFDLIYQYETGDSGPVAVNVDVSAADTVGEVRTALETAINATTLNGLLSVTESGLLSINLLGGDASPLGFTNGTHFDNGGTLTASDGFDFDTDNDGDEDGDDVEVAFA